MRTAALKAPGLYVSGIESPAPLPGLTAVTGFVGIAERGPLNSPQPIRNWGEFTEVFGDMISYGHLPYAVYGFFLNGGQKCYVVRIANPDRELKNIGACPRLDPLQAAGNEEPIQDRNGNETITISAIDQGRWGNDVQVEISYNAHKALLTRQADPADTIVHVNTTHDFTIGEQITITGRQAPPLSKSFTIADIDRNKNQIILTAPIDLTFSPESVIAGQRLSQNPIQLARIDQETAATDTVIKVDAAVDFADGDQLWIVHKANPLLKRLYEVQDADIANQTVTLKSNVGEIFPKASSVLGRGFRMTVTFRNRREDFEDLSMNPDHPRYFVYTINGDPALSRSYIEKQDAGHSILINAEQVSDGELSRFRPAPGVHRLSGGGDGFTSASNSLKDETDGDSITVIARPRGRAGHNIRVRYEPFRTKTALRIPTEPFGPATHITVINAGGFSVNDTIKVASNGTTESRPITAVDPEHNIIHLASALEKAYPIGATVSVDNRFTITVYRDDPENPAAEFHYNLSIDAGDAEHYFKTHINSDSHYICVEEAGDAIQLPVEQEVELKGGRDPGNIDFRYYTGYGDEDFLKAQASGFGGLLGAATFENVAEINLLCMPDLWQLYPRDPQAYQTDYITGLNHSLHHCRKMGERLALLDLPPATDITDAVSWRSKIANSDLARFGALYYPWLVFTFQQNNYTVPPAGFVAGLTARSDAAAGVNKAPANLIVRGIVGLERSIDADEQEVLNVQGVNCLREFRDIGVKLWGGRTLSLEPTHRYINARRVILGIVKTLLSNLLWAVFEPNDKGLWKKIESSLNAFLIAMLIKGMMASDRPEDAFYVKCDDETNSPAAIDAGQVTTEIGVALVVPAEFIIMTVKKTADSINISEQGA